MACTVSVLDLEEVFAMSLLMLRQGSSPTGDYRSVCEQAPPCADEEGCMYEEFHVGCPKTRSQTVLHVTPLETSTAQLKSHGGAQDPF